jgi:hypothetical protein
MDDRGIDLRKYQPAKASRTYILKVIVYTLVLFGLIWFVRHKLEEKSAEAEKTVIRGVSIE